MNIPDIIIAVDGYSSTGKSTFARSLAKHLNKSIVAVNSQSDDEDNDRRSCLAACAKVIEGRNDVIGLVDEAETLLDNQGRYAQNSHDKAWINMFLEQTNRKMIWIINDKEDLHSAILRRFSFSVKFENLSSEQRTNTFKKILKRYNSSRLLTNDQIEKIINRFDTEIY